MQGYIYIYQKYYLKINIFLFSKIEFLYTKKNYRLIRIIFLKIKYTQHHKKNNFYPKKRSNKKTNEY
jgi:hypothetical protein